MLALLFTLFSWLGSADSTSTSNAVLPLSEPDSHYVLANMYFSQGMWMSAAEQYELSSRLHGDRDVGRLQKLATLDRWMRKYTDAESWLRRGLALEPQNPELLSNMHDLEAQRSIHLFGALGGDEIDYTHQAYQVGAFLGYVDWLDLYTSYSAVDRVFFKRNTLSIDAYFFPTYSIYIRLGMRYRRYVYDQATTVPPDQNAYAQVPDVQAEVSQMYGTGNSISIEGEYFRPNFYWNPHLRGENFKAGVTLRQSVAGPVYIRMLGAVLRDPDPESFKTDLLGKVESFRYELLGLFGGGLGYDDGMMQAEVKYIPDRDLDRSLDWSVFGMVRYGWDRFGIRYDILYDRYRRTPSPALTSPTVHMVSVQWSPDVMVDLTGGVKTLSRETTDVVPFIQFRYRTGGIAR